MNYVQIQQFLVLSKTMNMTKAAKELYITQPALSHSLAKMEDELGLKLVYRDGNRLVMTEEGRSLLKDFEVIERAYEEMSLHAAQMREKHDKQITLGFAGSITAFSTLFEYGIMSSFRGTNIRKIFAEHDIIDNMLQNGQIDFAITFPPLSRNNIESRVLIHDPIRLAVAEGHPLLKKSSISLGDLKGYELLSLTEDNPFVAYHNQLLHQRNITLSYDKRGYNDLVDKAKEGRHGGKILSLSTENQFPSWFGAGYRCVPITDFDEALITAISWRTDSNFGYEYKDLIDYLEVGYDRVYFRNYKTMRPE